MESSSSSDEDLPGVRKLVTPPPAPTAPSVQRNVVTPTPIQNREIDTQTSPQKNDHCVSCSELKTICIEFNKQLENMKELAVCLTENCETLRSGVLSLPVPPTPRNFFSTTPCNLQDFPDPERILQKHLERERLERNANAEAQRSAFAMCSFTPVPPRERWTTPNPPTLLPQVNLEERKRLAISESESSSASPPIKPKKIKPIEERSESSSSEDASEEEDMNWTPSKKSIETWKFPKQRPRKRKISSSSSSDEMSTLEQMAPTPPSHTESQAPNLSLFNSQSELRQIVYKCDKCATLFTTELGLLSHKHEKHSKQTSSAEMSLLNSPSANLFSLPKAIAKPMPLLQKRPQGRPRIHPVPPRLLKPKTFKCKECSKQFNSNYSLKEHMAFHQGLTKCVYCKVVYCSAYGLKRHLTTTQTTCAEKHKKIQLTNRPGPSGSAPKASLISANTVTSAIIKKPQAVPKIVLASDVICID